MAGSRSEKAAAATGGGPTEPPSRATTAPATMTATGTSTETEVVRVTVAGTLTETVAEILTETAAELVSETVAGTGTATVAGTATVTVAGTGTEEMTADERSSARVESHQLPMPRVCLPRGVCVRESEIGRTMAEVAVAAESAWRWFHSVFGKASPPPKGMNG
jgi:hypothetical protein